MLHAIEQLEPRQMLSVTTVNVAAAVANATSNPTQMLGVNLAYWDDKLSTAQTKTMVQAAGLNEFRFPGGSAADDFHFNVATNWGDTAANTVPQFAKFIESVGGTGVVTLDYGSASPQEAEAELAYLVGSLTDTTNIGTGLEWNDTAGAWQSVNWKTVGYWAGLRAESPLGVDDGLNFLRINHASIFSGITSWEVGNEEYGSWEVDHHGTAGPSGNTGAQHDPATYAAFCASLSAFVTADQTKLPAIRIGIDSGDPTGADDGNWTRNVLSDGLTDGFVPGFISDHSYMQEPGSESDSFLLNDTVSDAASVLDWTTRYSDYQTLLSQTLGDRASSVLLSATEFNSVSYNPGKQSTSLVNGLFVADSLGSLLSSGYSGGYIWDLRNYYDTSQNNSASLYGWRNGGDYGLLGDPDNSSPPATGPYVPYPDYFAEQLVSKVAVAGGQVVSASTNTSTASVYAIKEANGHLELLVINKSSTASLTDQFNISGYQPATSAQVWQYGKTQDTAQSTSGNGASALANSTATLTLNGSSFSYTFPAYTMTVLDLSQAIALTGSNYLKMDGTTAGQLDVWAGTTHNGTPTATYILSQIGSITATGTSATVTVDFSNGDPLPATGLTDVGGGSPASNQLLVIGSTGNDAIVAGADQMSLNGVPMGYSDVGKVIFTPGIGVDSLAVNAGTLTLAGTSENFSTIVIGAGAVLSMASSPAGSAALLVTGTLSLAGSSGAWTGKCDLSNNDMDITGESLTLVANQVNQGFNGGSWSGLGITSSTAAADSSHLTAVAVIQNNQTGPTVFNSTRKFEGIIPGASDILLKYTYYGDANLDGKVDGSDYTKIDGGFNSHLTGWLNGDFNGDGPVDGSDYTLIDNAFNTQGFAMPTAQPTSRVFIVLSIAGVDFGAQLIQTGDDDGTANLAVDVLSMNPLRRNAFAWLRALHPTRGHRFVADHHPVAERQ